MMVIGVSNMIGRIVSGAVSDISCVNSIVFNSVSFLATGVKIIHPQFYKEKFYWIDFDYKRLIHFRSFNLWFCLLQNVCSLFGSRSLLWDVIFFLVSKSRNVEHISINYILYFFAFIWLFDLSKNIFSGAYWQLLYSSSLLD